MGIERELYRTLIAKDNDEWMRREPKWKAILGGITLFGGAALFLYLLGVAGY